MTRTRRWLSGLLPVCLLALLLHVHAVPQAAFGPRLETPDAACPACAVLQGSAGAPEPEVHLPIAPEPALSLDGPLSLPEHSRGPLGPSSRGPPSQV